MKPLLPRKQSTRVAWVQEQMRCKGFCKQTQIFTASGGDVPAEAARRPGPCTGPELSAARAGTFLFFFTTETRLKRCHTPGNTSAAVRNSFRATLASIQGGERPIFALRSSGVGSAECVWTRPGVTRRLGTQQGSEPTPETPVTRLIMLTSQHSSQQLHRPLHLLKHALKRQKH